MPARTFFNGLENSVANVDYQRCLYMREDLSAVLNLSPEQIGSLIDTGQLNTILICGEERFDSREVSELIQTYIRVTRRSKNDHR